MADKKKILFWPDVYKEQGHWLPTLAWADFINSYGKLASGKNFEVQYMGIADCEEIVKNFKTTHPAHDDENIFNYNKIFTEIYREGYTNEVQTTPSSRWKPDHVWVLAYSGLNDTERKKISVSDKEDREAEVIRNLFNSYSPDLLVSGYFTALETLIIYYNVPKSGHFHDKLKFAISTTYLRHPYEDPASRALQNLMAFSPEEQKKLLNIVVRDCSDPKKLLNDPGMTLEEFVAPLRTFPEFIPCPKMFDYSHYEHGPKVHYVEPCINKELAVPNGESPIDNWEDFLAEHDKIVFVTAGSQILDYKDKAVVLFQSIIGAMQASDMKDYHLIICAGSTLVQELSSDYENVTICGWAPQHTILSALADGKHDGSCAIIHGGLATIKECVYYDVPFLVLPLGKDQMDNALRLEDCGINNRFHLEYIKPKCLRYFINQILQDYKSRLNLKKLSGVFHKSEESHIGANAIAYLATNGNLDGFVW